MMALKTKFHSRRRRGQPGHSPTSPTDYTPSRAEEEREGKMLSGGGRGSWALDEEGACYRLLNRTLPNQNVLYRKQVNRTLLKQESGKTDSPKPHVA